MSESKLSPPRIVCAANRMTMDDGNGGQSTIVVAGARHHDGVMNPVIRALIGGNRDRIMDMEQGFIDQHNQYYSRKEAWVIAEANNQIVKRVGGDGPEAHGLFSENLY